MVKIALDAGHGMHTAGKRTPDGEREWSFNNKVLLATVNKLNEYENVEILRLDDSTGNTDVPLKTRTDKANAWRADVLVSIHHNAHTGKWGSHGGVETYTQPGSSKESVDIAKTIQPRLVKAMGLRDRGCKTLNLHMLRESKMTSILTESGFMDSTVDIIAMRDDTKLKAQGEAIALGLAEYFKLKLKAKPTAPVSNPKPTPTGDLYRVRKTWTDVKSQIGAYADLDNAKAMVDKNKDYKAFDEKGKEVYSATVAKPAPKPTPTPPKPVSSTSKTESIVNWMNVNKMDSSMPNRAKLAVKYGIKDYKGTADQNISLLNRLKEAVKPPVSAPAKPAPIASLIGKRVESKVDGLHFYSRPTWDRKYSVGELGKGIGFPNIIGRISVDGAYQYRVKNSRGQIFYVTASDKYVRIK